MMASISSFLFFFFKKKLIMKTDLKLNLANVKTVESESLPLY